MKKLLSILAAVGLTATASTAVVACTTSVKDSKVTKDGINGTATFEETIKFDKGTALTAHKGKATPTATTETVLSYTVDSSAYVFVKDTKDNTKKKAEIKNAFPNATITFTLKDASKIDANKDIENGGLKKAKSLKVTIEIKDDSLKNAATSTELKLALVKKGTDATKTDTFGKVDSVVSKVTIKTPTFAKATVNHDTTKHEYSFTQSITLDPNDANVRVAAAGAGATDTSATLTDNDIQLVNNTLTVDGVKGLATGTPTMKMSAADGAKFVGTTKATTPQTVTITVSFADSDFKAYKDKDFTYTMDLQFKNVTVSEVSIDVAKDANAADAKAPILLKDITLSAPAASDNAAATATTVTLMSSVDLGTLSDQAAMHDLFTVAIAQGEGDAPSNTDGGAISSVTTSGKKVVITFTNAAKAKNVLTVTPKAGVFASDAPVNVTEPDTLV